MIYIQTKTRAIITVTNQAGTILAEKNLDRTGVIDLSNLPEGVYYVKTKNTTNKVQKQ